MVLRGYIDESYDSSQRGMFALSCLMSTGAEWFQIEREWKLHLAAANKRLRRQGRPLISRYHASDCSSRQGEFAGWSTGEQITFVKGLFGILKRHKTNTVAYALNLDEVCEVFPEAQADRLRAGYSILTKFLMTQTISDLRGKHPNLKMTFIHDRCNYDSTMLDAFNVMIRDSEYAEFFVSITPESWEHCIALQPADMVAFEMFKEAERGLVGRSRRKSLNVLLDMKSFGVRARVMTKQNLIQTREVMERVEVPISR